MFYDYECKSCDNRIEIRHRPADVPEFIHCNKCGINYDRLPENLKTGDTTFLKNPQYSR